MAAPNALLVSGQFIFCFSQDQQWRERFQTNSQQVYYRMATPSDLYATRVDTMQGTVTAITAANTQGLYLPRCYACVAHARNDII